MASSKLDQARKRNASILRNNQRDRMLGAGVGVAAGAGVGWAHNFAATKGYSLRVTDSAPIGFLGLAGLGIAAAGLAKRSKYSTLLAMTGTAIAAADLGVLIAEG